MRLFIFLAFVGGVIAGLRIYFNIRKIRAAEENDWDAKLIERLRLSGSDPFKSHEVDFFFGMPNERAAQSTIERLVSDGFHADYRHVPEHIDFPYSIHARKAMRLAVPDMQATSRKFSALAREFEGRYDGWSAAHVGRTDDGGITLRKAKRD